MIEGVDMNAQKLIILILTIVALSGIVSAVKPVTELSVEGDAFTVNGEKAFLFGISYYGALGARRDFITRDLDDMQKLGINWIRVWATWGAFDNDVTAVDKEGNPREPYFSRLQWLIAECDRRGIMVDVTISRGNSVVGPPRLQSLEVHRKAVETLVTKLKPFRNWYLDLGNERNIEDKRHITMDELKVLREAAKRIDPSRLITASRAGDIPTDELGDYLFKVQVDFLSPHRPRNAKSSVQTLNKSREYLAAMKDMGKVVPLHYQEPFRRSFTKGWNPSAQDFITDAQNAFQGGAAGWCLHNGDQRHISGAPIRRSFDMREKRLFEQLDEEEEKALGQLGEFFRKINLEDIR